MGRMFDALKAVETTHDEAVPEPRVLAMEPPSFLPEGEDEEGDRPFIEVGPHRSLEGSADVLAAPPPAPRVVAFRAVPPAQSRISPDVLAFHQPGHSVSSQFRDLLNTIQAALPGRGPAALLFSGIKAGVGTTTVVLNLAICAAQPGRRRIVVVDGNERPPALAHRLGLPESPGLAEILAGTCPLEKAVQATEQADLFALTAGIKASAGPLRFQAETLGSLLRRLRQQFDLVFVDGPVWNGQPEVTSPGRVCDAVFLVTSAGDAGSPHLDELFIVLPEQGARLAGCIVAGR